MILASLLLLAAGCHNNNNATSGYGIVWTTVTDEPGDYASYIVTIDAVTLTRTDGTVVTAIGTPEIVDFAQLRNFHEMWGSGGVPVGTYTSATITFNYTGAVICVIVNGKPQQAKVIDLATNTAPATYSVSVKFDPAHPLNITPTFASTSAQRLAVHLDLAASGRVNLATNPATVYVRPYVTAGVVTPDTRPIRVRGPLINTSAGAGPAGSYTVYVRPFYDEANNIGTLSLFTQPSTVWSINGNTYVGAPGLTELSTLSAGTTMTAGWTQFVVDYNTANSAYAGTFNLLYVVGGSTLEDNYTEGISGDVIARTGNTLTLQGATLFLNTANVFYYQVGNSQVLLGAGTIVTADDNTTLTGLNANSIGVGQHISVRGIYSVLPDGNVKIDATGTSSTNTGSVRLQQTAYYGSLVSSAAGGLTMDLKAINDWPVSDYIFTGNGAVTPDPAAFSVTTAGLSLPAGTLPGAPVWVNGFIAPFGRAPPDASAVAANDENSVQLAGTQLGGGTAVPPGPGTTLCGVGSQVCESANLRVQWIAPYTSTPFLTSSVNGFAINLGNAALGSAVIRIGAESIDLKSLPSSPLVVPTTAAPTATFAPQYSFGNPTTATVTPTVAASTTFLNIYDSYTAFIPALEAAINTANPATQMVAQGVYNRSTNTFSATSIDFVL